jgi:hypothetical protein
MSTDLKKEQMDLYAPPREPTLVEVPEMRYLMVDGKGDPNDADFVLAVEALYAVSYTLKFSLKAAGFDFKVMPLEGLWWAGNPEAFLSRDMSEWQWTAMIRQPDILSEGMLEQAKTAVAAKKGLKDLGQLCLETLAEGMSVQMMHIGPYSAEAPNIGKMHEFMRANRLDFAGKHHEIYLSDPKRCAPEKMKTVLRQPVR